MTTLEITLIGIMWICYGVFAVYRTDKHAQGSDSEARGWFMFLTVSFAPIVLVGRAIIGIFKEYD